MKKHILSFLLALVVCLSFIPMTAPAFAATDTPVISNLAVVYDNEAGQCYLTFNLENADAAYDGIQGQYSAGPIARTIFLPTNTSNTEFIFCISQTATARGPISSS